MAPATPSTPPARLPHPPLQSSSCPTVSSSHLQRRGALIPHGTQAAALSPAAADSFHDVRKRHENNKENSSHQWSNGIRLPNGRQTEWARPGTVLNRTINRGGYSRNSLPGITHKFRIVKDNRTKHKVDGKTVLESSHSGNSSDGHAVSNFRDKSLTEKLDSQCNSDTQNSNGHGAIQADNECKTQAHENEGKPSSDQELEQSKGMRTTLVGSDAVLEKGNQNKLLTVPSGTKNFIGDLCCSSSDPIHVPSVGSKTAGTYGAIKCDVGVVGSRHRPSDSAATNTSTSNTLVTVTTATHNNASTELQCILPGASPKNSHSISSVPLSSRPFPSSQYQSKPSINAGHSKVNPYLEWKRKSVSPRTVNHAVTVSPSSATSSVVNQAGLADLSKKISQANISKDENVIIPKHLRVPDSERAYLIFGTFESEVKPKSLTSTSDTPTKEGLNNNSTSMTGINSARFTDDVPPVDQRDLVSSLAALPQSDSIFSVSEHQQPLAADMEVPNRGIIGEYRSKDMILGKTAPSLPDSQDQGNLSVQNFKAYEPDSRYGLPFITKVSDGETAQTISYSSEIMGFHSSDVNQLSVSATTQQIVPQMYQQVQVPQYPNLLPYRHVFSPYYVPPVAVPNYSSNPAFPQLPHVSSYLVMPNRTSQLAANGVKYGPAHQYKQVFPSSPAGYGGCANQNGYPISTGAMCSTGPAEDASMCKYSDNNPYTPNSRAEIEVWNQAHRDIPNMPSTAFYNLMGQPVSPHTAYIPGHNSHAPFSPASHAPHLQYPGMPHTLQPTTMTMVQNPQSMVHQPAAPPLAGNIGIEMPTIAPGAQVGAFQQNQLGHLGWAPNF